MSFGAVTTYEKYLARAKAVVSGAPYWKYIDNGDFAKLTVEGGEATLWWLDISSGYYGSWETDSLSISFPATLLTMHEERFTEWKTDEDAKYKRAEEEATHNAIARKAAAERAQAEAILKHGVMVAGKRYKLTPQE